MNNPWKHPKLSKHSSPISPIFQLRCVSVDTPPSPFLPNNSHLKPCTPIKHHNTTPTHHNTPTNINDSLRSPLRSSTPTSRDYYFDSYSHYGIHEEMLRDKVRTETYRDAILNNPHLFHQKIVLDVGCGTGILSMFAAKAGARRVYGIDCSRIIEKAREIVKKNGLDDVITLLQGKVEDVELPKVEYLEKFFHKVKNQEKGTKDNSYNNNLKLDMESEKDHDKDNHNDNSIQKVDVIISEWMGYFLLYESMLDTVLFARDKWLIPSGTILPDKAVLYVTAIEDNQMRSQRLNFWTNVYGFDFSPIYNVAMKEVVVDCVEEDKMMTNSVPILTIDMLTISRNHVSSSIFESNFTLRVKENNYVHAIVAYFECAFTQLHKPMGFSTGPFAKYTHWKQTLFYLHKMLTVCEGEEIHGRIKCRNSKENKRDLDVGLDLWFSGLRDDVKFKQEYHLR